MLGALSWKPDACCVVADVVLSVTGRGRQSELGPQDCPVEPDGGEAGGPDLAWEKGALMAPSSSVVPGTFVSSPPTRRGLTAP